MGAAAHTGEPLADEIGSPFVHVLRSKFYARPMHSATMSGVTTSPV